VRPEWGDPISEERQRELFTHIVDRNAPSAEHDKRKGPGDRMNLTGAGVSYLGWQWYQINSGETSTESSHKYKWHRATSRGKANANGSYPFVR
jgi:hypothetical protein